MKQRLGSGKRMTQQLSDSLHRQLNSYALAASAAGVSMLALVQPAEGKVVYTPAHHVIVGNESYGLDLNHDRKPDFFISNFGTTCNTDECWRNLGISVASGNAVVGSQQGELYAALALHRGARIDSKNLLYHGAAMAVVNEPPGTTCLSGDWCNVANRYLGLKFKIHGQLHYAWARLSVRVKPHSVTAILTGYAYETIPNKPIIAGKTKGPDVVTIEPATLGRLAQGTSGLAAWRSRQQ
jgi:hypothetical protein